jgi:hypothetical protein
MEVGATDMAVTSSVGVQIDSSEISASNNVSRILRKESVS